MVGRLRIVGRGSRIEWAAQAEGPPVTHECRAGDDCGCAGVVERSTLVPFTPSSPRRQRIEQLGELLPTHLRSLPPVARHRARSLPRRSARHLTAMSQKADRPTYHARMPAATECRCRAPFFSVFGKSSGHRSPAPSSLARWSRRTAATADVVVGTPGLMSDVSSAMRILLAVASALVLVSSCTGARDASTSIPPATRSATTPSVQPVQPARELPPPTHNDYRWEFVSNKSGYRVWPISGAAEPGVAYRFAVPHCGLEWMTDFDSSFWQPLDPNVVDPQVPAFFINADRGTIELVARNTAEYVSSTGRPVVLRRLDGPIVTQPCD